MSNSSRHSGRDRRHPYRRDGRNDRDFRDSRDTRNNSGPPPRDGYRPSYPSFDTNRDRNHDQGRPRDVPPYPGTDRGADSYRPPQSDFTFRVDKPAGIQLANSYRPQHDRSPRNDRRDIRSFHSDSRKNARDRRQGRDRPRRPFIAAERELLKANHDDGEGIALYDPNGGVTYRPLNELSDSDEAEMDISDDDAAADATDGDEPPHKRARLGVQQSTSESVTPKWSNPDPYTALPPETVPQGKKKDVVQLIRKSRVQTNPVRTSLPTETADFIALDLDSEESDAGNEAEAPTESPEAPVAPDEVITISDDDQSIDGEEEASESEISAPSGPGEPVTHRQDAFISPSDLATFTLANSRKRTHDGEIKMPHAPLKQATKKRGAGAILKEWRPTPEMHPTPWLERDHSDSANMAVWLHKEIVDFYEWIKPRDFEAYQRQKLIEKLSDMVREEFHKADVYPFGSFPSGLYLPTGDMDVAMMSNSYVKGGAARFTGTRVLYRFKDYLVRHRIAWANEIQLITRARVPLVKFVEIKTGLKVDVSFENSTGVAALKTFRAWREKYPGMPALVTIIKQFLMMRGLNEPVNGGIGGFSVICLVVSMLQQMPEVNSGNLDTRHHLGQLLLHFFDLYGNKFDYEKVAISLNPPRWIPKSKVKQIQYKNLDRLSIIDPNNRTNDISGGSSNTKTILALFSEAHKVLTERMTQLAKDPNRAGQSILGVLLGGNYISFETQRNFLKMLTQKEKNESSHESFRDPGSSFRDSRDSFRDSRDFRDSVPGSFPRSKGRGQAGKEGQAQEATNSGGYGQRAYAAPGGNPPTAPKSGQRRNDQNGYRSGRRR